MYFQLCVHVQVPLCESLLGWLCELNLALVSLSNREIAAYVQDQITPLNLSRLRTAKLVRQGIFQSTVSSLPLLKYNMKSFANLLNSKNIYFQF
jgi:hypothetical protein